MTRPEIRWLGRLEYGAAWALQRDLVQARVANQAPDTLLLCEHPDVITVGRRIGAVGNLLAPGDIPIFEVERGGDVTYHGPGQLVGYPILRLEGGRRDLHRYLRDLEEVLITAAGSLGVPSGRAEGRTGTWVAGQRKLASIGVAVRRWVTLHGFALNVSTDLEKFEAINPCGFPAGVMTSLSVELGRPLAMGDARAAVESAFVDVFADLGREVAANPTP